MSALFLVVTYGNIRRNESEQYTDQHNARFESYASSSKYCWHSCLNADYIVHNLSGDGCRFVRPSTYSISVRIQHYCNPVRKM